MTRRECDFCGREIKDRLKRMYVLNVLTKCLKVL